MADFADLKSEVPIQRFFEDMFGVKDFKQAGINQLLGTCPKCRKKALKITPSMGLCNCFGCDLGGDIIKVYAFANNLNLNDAGNAIAAHFAIGGSSKNRAFNPLDYQKRLNPDAPELTHLGVSAHTIREFGGGYCAKGKLAGRLALPIYEDGRIVSFLGCLINLDEPPKDDDELIKFGRDIDEQLLFNTQHIADREPLGITRYPIQVLRAHEMGDTQAIAVFRYTPETLRRIAALMAEHHIEEAELF